MKIVSNQEIFFVKKLENLNKHISNICYNNINEIKIYSDCGYGKEMRTTARDTIKHISCLINDVLKEYIQYTNTKKELLVLSQLICRNKLTEQESLNKLTDIYVNTLEEKENFFTYYINYFNYRNRDKNVITRKQIKKNKEYLNNRRLNNYDKN